MSTHWHTYRSHCHINIGRWCVLECTTTTTTTTTVSVRKFSNWIASVFTPKETLTHYKRTTLHSGWHRISVLLYELLDSSIGSLLIIIWVNLPYSLSFCRFFFFFCACTCFGVCECRFKSVLVTHLQHLSHRFRTFVNWLKKKFLFSNHHFKTI